MKRKEEFDVVVVGSGPNGLAASIELALNGFSVCVFESSETVGGGMKTLERTLPGFLHDECSAIHPMGFLSPFLSSLPLGKHGLEWLHFESSVAHPLEDRPAPILSRSFDETGRRLGKDGPVWRELLEPLIAHPSDLMHDVLGPLRMRMKRPFVMARFGLHGVRTAESLARKWFAGEEAKALFAGCAGHSVLPLSFSMTAAVGLIFCATGHIANWPCVKGGSKNLALALASYLEELGGSIRLGTRISALKELPASRAVLFDLTPEPFIRIAGDELPSRYVARLGAYRYGPGTFKVDWALSGSIPWIDPEVSKASTVHVGGTLEEIAEAEKAAWVGRLTERPFVIVCQQSEVDPSRAPNGKHTGYGYCHVPAGSSIDMTERIEAQIERFAPGFRDRIEARAVTRPSDFARLNSNNVGGAVTGGSAELKQLFTRPVARVNPYTTPNPKLFLCSAATPPGGGVHGMCGFHAARTVIKRLKKM